MAGVKKCLWENRVRKIATSRYLAPMERKPSDHILPVRRACPCRMVGGVPRCFGSFSEKTEWNWHCQRMPWNASTDAMRICLTERNKAKRSMASIQALQRLGHDPGGRPSWAAAQLVDVPRLRGGGAVAQRGGSCHASAQGQGTVPVISVAVTTVQRLLDHWNAGVLPVVRARARWGRRGTWPRSRTSCCR